MLPIQPLAQRHLHGAHTWRSHSSRARFGLGAPSGARPRVAERHEVSGERGSPAQPLASPQIGAQVRTWTRPRARRAKLAEEADVEGSGLAWNLKLGFVGRVRAWHTHTFLLTQALCADLGTASARVDQRHRLELTLGSSQRDLGVCGGPAPGVSREGTTGGRKEAPEVRRGVSPKNIAGFGLTELGFGRALVPWAFFMR